MDLLSKKSVPTQGGTQPLESTEINLYLSSLKNKWEVVDGKKIKYEFVFSDFMEAMAFVNKVAQVADGEGHHPDIHIYYNKVLIELWTHAIGGLSENDFIVAAKIEPLI